MDAHPVAGIIACCLRAFAAAFAHPLCPLRIPFNHTILTAEKAGLLTSRDGGLGGLLGGSSGWGTVRKNLQVSGSRLQ